MDLARLLPRSVLPLPPFEVWLSDYETNHLAHMGAGMERPPPVEPTEPMAVEVRRIDYQEEPWRGTLEVYRGRDVWRGLIRFQRDGEKRCFRTGEIFCEDDLQDVRNRFKSFTALTMRAFLRSTLP